MSFMYKQAPGTTRARPLIPPFLGTLTTHRGQERLHAELWGGTVGYLSRTALCGVTQPLTTPLGCWMPRKYRTVRKRYRPRRRIRCR